MNKVYVLQHSYEDADHEDSKLIGVYSSFEQATSAIERLKDLSGFRLYRDNFVIDEYQIDDDNWSQGFGL